MNGFWLRPPLLVVYGAHPLTCPFHHSDAVSALSGLGHSSEIDFMLYCICTIILIRPSISSNSSSVEGGRRDGANRSWHLARHWIQRGPVATVGNSSLFHAEFCLIQILFYLVGLWTKYINSLLLSNHFQNTGLSEKKIWADQNCWETQQYSLKLCLKCWPAVFPHWCKYRGITCGREDIVISDLSWLQPLRCPKVTWTSSRSVRLSLVPEETQHEPCIKWVLHFNKKFYRWEVLHYKITSHTRAFHCRTSHRGSAVKTRELWAKLHLRPQNIIHIIKSIC